MNIRRIKETCIYVSDLEKTKFFYHHLLGLPLLSTVAERHLFFKAGESVLLCFIASKTEMETAVPPHGAHGSIHFAFEVAKEDYEATLATIKEKNIEIVQEHVWKSSIRSFYFHDPDNNLVEIIEEGLWD